MCNAWNHPPGCRCGWGGDGHLGQGGGDGGAWSNRSIRFASSYTKEDFCRPTKCPVCGIRPVYFIRHNGGSFWVDEPGWPWEKHACFSQDVAHTRLMNDAKQLRRPQPGLVVECFRRPDLSSDLVIVDGERGQRYLVQVKHSVEVNRLPGELVIVSLPDCRMSHRYVGSNDVVQITVGKTIFLPPAPPTPIINLLPSKPWSRDFSSPIHPQPKKKKIVAQPPTKPAFLQKPKPVSTKPATPKPIAQKPVLTEPQALALIRQLLDKAPLKRIEALIQLKQHREIRAVTPLTRRLFDVEPSIRLLAAETLTMLGCGHIAQAVLQLYTPSLNSQARIETMDTVRKAVAKSLQVNNNSLSHLRQQGVYLVGQLRLQSLIPSLLSACHPSNTCYLRRTAAEAIWRLNSMEALPLALLLSADNDPTVRRYSVAALADLQEFTMSALLLNDPDKTVRDQAQECFQVSDSSTKLIDRYRIPDFQEPITDPIINRESACKLKLDQIEPFAGQLIRSNNTANRKAGVAALLWCGTAESYSILTNLARGGSEGAREALSEHFGVPASATDSASTLSHKQGELIQPLQRKRHSIFRNIPPGLTVLIIGGDGKEEVYRKVLAEYRVSVRWGSGIGPSLLRRAEVENIHAVIFVGNAVSMQVYRHALALIRAVGGVPHAFSQTISVVSITRTLCSLVQQK